jgi:hypothetical protein
MRRRHRVGTRAVLLATLLLAGFAGCERGAGDGAAGASPFRNLGKRADADFGAARPAPAR